MGLAAGKAIEYSETSGLFLENLEAKNAERNADAEISPGLWSFKGKVKDSI